MRLAAGRWGCPECEVCSQDVAGSRQQLEELRGAWEEERGSLQGLLPGTGVIIPLRPGPAYYLLPRCAPPAVGPAQGSAGQAVSQGGGM